MALQLMPVGGELVLNLLAHDVAVLEEVLVVGADGEVLLGHARIGHHHVDQMVPKGPAGRSLHPLAPAHDQQGPHDHPLRQLGGRLHPGGTEFEEVPVDPIQIAVGFVEGLKGFHILLGDVLHRPGGHKVHQGGLVDVAVLLDQAALLIEAVPEGGMGQRLQHRERGGGDARLFREGHDPLTRASFLAIEADDEAGDHAQARAGHPVHRIQQW